MSSEGNSEIKKICEQSKGFSFSRCDLNSRDFLIESCEKILAVLEHHVSQPDSHHDSCFTAFLYFACLLMLTHPASWCSASRRHLTYDATLLGGFPLICGFRAEDYDFMGRLGARFGVINSEPIAVHTAQGRGAGIPYAGLCNFRNESERLFAYVGWYLHLYRTSNGGNSVQVVTRLQNNAVSHVLSRINPRDPADFMWGFARVATMANRRPPHMLRSRADNVLLVRRLFDICRGDVQTDDHHDLNGYGLASLLGNITTDCAVSCPAPYVADLDYPYIDTLGLTDSDEDDDLDINEAGVEVPPEIEPDNWGGLFP
ncbi:P0 protein [Grapevine enamovirus 1]|uniref:P0 protein n=1 Tax=Grapevine enamovirus 1 TaxID=2560515 RepID=A0A1B3B595_9VIRU|nr:P0 protein [Grapevine enamovirus 1]AOE46788.1 P0 protein [Grapevine enamovirus 1]